MCKSKGELTMKKAIFLLSLFLSLSTQASAVRAIAEKALEVYNKRLSANEIKQRLFEGYHKITEENCFDETSFIACQFDVINQDILDQDVYTPNLLKVTVDKKTNEYWIEFEWGC